MLQSGVVVRVCKPSTWEDRQELTLGLYSWNVKVFAQEK